MANGDWWLDVIDFGEMPAGNYLRVVPVTAGQPPQPVDPLAANPNFKVRLALVPESPFHLAGRGQFYVATSATGVLLEALLRSTCVFFSGKRIARLTLVFRNRRLLTMRLVKPGGYSAEAGLQDDVVDGTGMSVLVGAMKISCIPGATRRVVPSSPDLLDSTLCRVSLRATLSS